MKAREARWSDGLWLGFMALVLAGWAGLLALSTEHPDGPALGALSPGFDIAYWRALCAVAPADAGLAGLIAMWALMSAAMMAPTAVPTIAAYRTLTAGRPSAGLNAAAFVGGYLLVWAGYAVAAAALQAALARSGLISPHGISISPWVTGGLLLAAGAYQFTPLKAACLTLCRSPLGFVMSRWRGGTRGALGMGLRHGVICVGCCWALMLLAFVGGTMNLLWMGAAMVLMVLEKLPDIGAPLTRWIGYALLASGAAYLTTALVAG